MSPAATSAAWGDRWHREGGGGSHCLPRQACRRADGRAAQPTYHVVGDHFLGEVQAFWQWNLDTFIGLLCRGEKKTGPAECLANPTLLRGMDPGKIQGLDLLSPIFKQTQAHGVSSRASIHCPPLTVYDRHDGPLEQRLQGPL